MTTRSLLRRVRKIAGAGAPQTVVAYLYEGDDLPPDLAAQNAESERRIEEAERRGLPVLCIVYEESE